MLACVVVCRVCMHVQVSVDVPRTAPNVPFFHEALIQKSLERLLYIWGIRWVTSCVSTHEVCVCYVRGRACLN